jgi:DNA invertase Pin-like site-specific DNA recombinase
LVSRALIYARYSSALQRCASIEDQVRICRERAEREGWPVAGVFHDAEMSGRVRDRPGLNALLVEVGKGDVVLTESIDRLSRKGGDIWELFDRIDYAGARIVSLAEGDVAELHVGFKGTMSALFRKDLADKTRRGQVGRVLAGRYPGGRVYGYRRVARFDERGEPIRGLREINPDQAAVVARIFTEFADDRSKLDICRRLNREGIPGPSGGAWCVSTIGDILDNELYRGRLVFGQETRVYDPDNRRRRLRRTSPQSWTVRDVPEARIVSDALWEAAEARKRRQHRLRPESHRRPKRLLSGLLKCGCCGGNYIVIGREQWGCSRRRQRGDCDNGRTIATRRLERRVLAGLQTQLLAPEAVRQAVLDAHRASQARIGEAERDRRLADRRRDRAARDVDRLVRAVTDGGSEFAEIRDALTRARAELEAAETAIANSQCSSVVALHPNIADEYRRCVEELVEIVNGDPDDEPVRDARRAIRGLIDRVVVSPAESGRGTTITLEGRLEALLTLAGGPPVKPGLYDNEQDPLGSPALAYSLVRGRC